MSTLAEDVCILTSALHSVCYNMLLYMKRRKNSTQKREDCINSLFGQVWIFSSTPKLSKLYFTKHYLQCGICKPYQ